MPDTWLVSGPAGAGKSTLGRALARRLGAVLLDLDTVTNPLLDGLGALLPGHWNTPEHTAVVRPARYAALLALAASQEDLPRVLVAPFTAELRGGPEWSSLVSGLGVVPRVAWLDAPPEVLAARTAGRGEARDAVRPPAPREVPAVDHVRVDATLPTPAQLDRLT